MYVSPPDRPERMYQRHRQVLPDFDGREPLYLRYGREDFVEGQLALAAIRFPKTSVNRGSLSEPEDVLFAEDGKYNGLGVVEFEVSDVPPRIAQEQGPTYAFFMRHVHIPTTIRTARFGLIRRHRPATIGSRARRSSSDSEFFCANESHKSESGSKPSVTASPETSRAAPKPATKSTTARFRGHSGMAVSA